MLNSLLLRISIYFVSVFTIIGIYTALFLAKIHNDSPEPWAIGFQDGVSPGFTGIVELHDNIFFYLVVIAILVFWMLGSTIYYFNYDRTKITHKYLVHGTLIEILWTIFPAIVLLAIAIPSFRLLYILDEVTLPTITVKVTGFLIDGPKSYIINKIKNTKITCCLVCTRFCQSAMLEDLVKKVLYFYIRVLVLISFASSTCSHHLLFLAPQHLAIHKARVWGQQAKLRRPATMITSLQGLPSDFYKLIYKNSDRWGAGENKSNSPSGSATVMRLGIGSNIVGREACKQYNSSSQRQMLSLANTVSLNLIRKTSHDKLFSRTFNTRCRAINRIGPHNIDVISVVFGLLLGDGNANNRTGEGIRISIKQSEIHKEYLLFLYKFFFDRGYCTSLKPREYTRTIKGINKIYYGYEFNTYTFRSFLWIYKSFYKNGKKILPSNIEKHINELTLSVLIMDDGGWTGEGVIISTNSFTYTELERLIIIMKDKFGLDCTIQKINIKDRYSIYIKKNSIPKLRGLTIRYIHKSMLYKLGI